MAHKQLRSIPPYASMGCIGAELVCADPQERAKQAEHASQQSELWPPVQVYNTAQALADFLGKETCISQDRPGFIVNRVLMPMINEAFYTLMEAGPCCVVHIRLILWHTGAPWVLTTGV